MSGDAGKLGFREAWTAILYSALVLFGIAFSAYDLIILRGLRIQLNSLVIGVALVIVEVP